MSFGPTIYTQPTCEVFHIAPGSEDDAWNRIRAATSHALTEWGADFLRRGLKQHVKTVLVEGDYVCKDYRNLFSQFYSKKFCQRNSHCSRLHFFDSANISEEDIVFHPTQHQDSYIGYSVIEPVEVRCLGRSVIDPLKIGFDKSQFFCLRSSSIVRINGAEYKVHGFPYRSQSAEATVCAHSALWAACRYLSDRYPAYGEVYPYDLIELTGDANGRRVPYRGMTYNDYSTILSAFGCHPALIVPATKSSPANWTEDANSFYDLYAYMESGFPVLTGFSNHVVNIIGHTLTNTVQPNHKPSDIGGFINSAALLSEYIVVDDNFFPYQLLGYTGSKQYYQPSDYPGPSPPTIDNIYAAVVPLPEKAFLPPKAARDFAYMVMNHPQIRSVLDATLGEIGEVGGTPIVARQLLTSASSFKRRKRDYYLEKANDRLLTAPIGLNLPHFVWIIEFTSLNLFNTRRCCGEIIFDATIGPYEQRPIYARIGRHTLVNGGLTDFAGQPLAWPQYTNNLGRL